MSKFDPSIVRVVNARGGFIKNVSPKVARTFIASGRYRLISKRGIYIERVKDLDHRIDEARIASALQSVYRDQTPTYLMKRADGSRENFTLERDLAYA